MNFNAYGSGGQGGRERSGGQRGAGRPPSRDNSKSGGPGYGGGGRNGGGGNRRFQDDDQNNYDDDGYDEQQYDDRNDNNYDNRDSRGNNNNSRDRQASRGGPGRSNTNNNSKFGGPKGRAGATGGYGQSSNNRPGSRSRGGRDNDSGDEDDLRRSQSPLGGRGNQGDGDGNERDSRGGGASNFGGTGNRFGNTGKGGRTFGTRGGRNMQSTQGGRGRATGGGGTTLSKKEREQRGKPQRRDGKKINHFRDVCASFQQLGTNMREARLALAARAEKRLQGGEEVISFGEPHHTFEQQMQALLGDEWDEVQDKVVSTAEDFLQGGQRSGSMLAYAALFDRYELEMTKLLQMQRLFIQIRKRMDRISDPSNKTHKTDRTLPAVLSRYGVAITMHDDKRGGYDHRVNAVDFAILMERFGVIRSSKKQDTKFIFEEYGHDGEASDEEEQKKNNQGPKDAGANAGNEDPAASKFQQLNQAEAKRRAKVYFRIPEIEADFTYFEEVIIPELEEQVLIWIGRYLQEYPQDDFPPGHDTKIDYLTLSELFFSKKSRDEEDKQDPRDPHSQQLSLPNNQRHGDDKQQLLSDERRTTEYRPHVHIYDLYDIQEKISLMCDEVFGMKQRNFSSLFSVFALKGAGKDKLVPFSYVYRIARRERPQCILSKYVTNARDSDKRDSLLQLKLKKTKEEYDKEVKREQLINPVLDALGVGNKQNTPDPFVDPVVEAAMTQEGHKRLIMYVADVALGDKSCDVEQAFATERQKAEREYDNNNNKNNSRGGREFQNDQYNNNQYNQYNKVVSEMPVRDLVEILRAEPFCIFEHSYQGILMEEREVVSVLSNSYDVRNREREERNDDYNQYNAKGSDYNRRSSNNYNNKESDIDNDKFIADVKERMLTLQQRDEVIINFGSCMVERGLDYEMVFQTILGFKNVSNAEMDRNQFKLCFQLLNFAVEPKQFENFFRSLTQQDDDLINVADFLKEATKLQHGISAERNQQKLKKAVERSMRRYQKVSEIQRHIGKVISEEHLTEFGSLLKGQDFLDDGTIQRGHFFRTLMSIPALRDHDAGLKEGDVMDLMNLLDPDNTQSIALQRIKDCLDPFIVDSQCQITLKSKVKDICDEVIVERGETKQPGLRPQDVDKPKSLFTIVFDIFCGLYLQRRQPEQFFMDFSTDHGSTHGDQKFTSKKKRYVDYREFSQALVSLNVQAPEKQIFLIHKHFLDLQIQRTMLAQQKSFQEDGGVDSQFGSLRTDYLDCDFLCERLGAEVPYGTDEIKMEDKVVKKIAEKFAENQIPVLEIVRVFRQDLPTNNNQDSNKNTVMLNDFRDKMLGEYFKLSSTLTANQSEMLCVRYRDKRYPNYIEMDRFVEDVQEQSEGVLKEQQLGGGQHKRTSSKGYRSPQKADDFNFNQEWRQQDKSQYNYNQTGPAGSYQATAGGPEASTLKSAFKTKQGNSTEPIYEARTSKNTFMTAKERAKLSPAWLSDRSACAPHLQDVMLRTRAYGLCVEAYFQQFGSKMPHGLTELTPDQFQRAIKSLGLSWADDRRELEMMYDCLDKDPDNAQRGTMGLDEIAIGIHDCVMHSCEDFEIQYLESTYQILKKTRIFGQIKDMMNFLNFNRDYSCTVPQYIDMFRNNFKISEFELEDWRIKVLMQRYITLPKTDQKGVKKTSAGGKDKQKSISKSNVLSNNYLNTKVSVFSMYQDFGNRNSGISFASLKFQPLAERIVKALHLQDPRQQTQGASFSTYIKKYGNQYDNSIAVFQFQQACADLIGEERRYHGIEELATKEELADFLSHIGKLKAITNNNGHDQNQYQQRYGNDYQYQHQDQQQQQHSQASTAELYSLDSVTDGFRSLFTKSSVALFQDTLSIIYLESKRQDLSQTIFTIFTEIDEIDGTKDGYVTTQQFIDAIISILGTNNKPNNQSQELIDFEYLSLKYRQMEANLPEERDRVFYKAFYNDYEYLDCNGLSGSIYGLDDLLEQRDMPATSTVVAGGVENPFKFDIPQKFLDFYMMIERWIRKKKRTEKFCESIVREDRQKEGFLSNRQLDRCFHDIGMELTKKQIGQISYPLHQDDQGRFSYPELLELIFGHQEWPELQKKFGLTGTHLQTSSGGAQNSRIHFSDNLRMMSEYYYNDLLAAQAHLSRGSQMLKEDEFLRIFSDVGIEVMDDRNYPNDLANLKVFFKEQTVKSNGMLDGRSFFKYAEITDQVVKLSAQLQAFLRPEDKQTLANKALGQKQYTFDDMVAFMKKVDFDMAQYVYVQYESNNNKENQNQGRAPAKGAVNSQEELPQLYKLFKATRQAGQSSGQRSSMLTKQQMYKMFEINKREVRFEEPAADDLPSLKKPKVKTEGAKESAAAPETSETAPAGSVDKLMNAQLQAKLQSTINAGVKNIYSKKRFQVAQINAVVNSLTKFINADPARKQRITSIKEARISVENFKRLLTELNFPVNGPKDLERFEALVQAFKSQHVHKSVTASAPAKADNRDNKGEGPQEGAGAANANQEQKKPAPALPAGSEPPVLPQEKDCKCEEYISITRLKQKCGVTSEPQAAARSLPAASTEGVKDVKGMIEYIKEHILEKNKRDLPQLFKEMDKNNNGQVTVDEFKAYFQGQPKFKLDPNNLNELFKALDTQNKGFIDLQQLVTGFRDKIDIAILQLFKKASRNTESVDIQTLYHLVNSLRSVKLIDFEKTLMDKYHAPSHVDIQQFTSIIQTEIATKESKMKSEFTKEDKDKDGKLNMVEFKTALKREGLQDKEIQAIMQIADMKKTGYVVIADLIGGKIVARIVMTKMETVDLPEAPLKVEKKGGAGKQQAAQPKPQVKIEDEEDDDWGAKPAAAGGKPAAAGAAGGQDDKKKEAQQPKASESKAKPEAVVEDEWDTKPTEAKPAKTTEEKQAVKEEPAEPTKAPSAQPTEQKQPNPTAEKEKEKEKEKVQEKEKEKDKKVEPVAQPKPAVEKKTDSAAQPVADQTKTTKVEEKPAVAKDTKDEEAAKAPTSPPVAKQPKPAAERPAAGAEKSGPASPEKSQPVAAAQPAISPSKQAAAAPSQPEAATKPSTAPAQSDPVRPLPQAERAPNTAADPKAQTTAPAKK